MSKKIIIKAAILIVSMFGYMQDANAQLMTQKKSDVGIVSIDGLEAGMVPDNFTPKVTIQNYGLTEHCFELQMKINNGYFSKQTIVLRPLASATVIFKEVSMSKGKWKFSTVIISNTDGNPANNKMEKMVEFSSNAKKKFANLPTVIMVQK